MVKPFWRARALIGVPSEWGCLASLDRLRAYTSAD